MNDKIETARLNRELEKELSAYYAKGVYEGDLRTLADKEAVLRRICMMQEYEIPVSIVNKTYIRRRYEEDVRSVSSKSRSPERLYADRLLSLEEATNALENLKRTEEAEEAARAEALETELALRGSKEEKPRDAKKRFSEDLSLLIQGGGSRENVAARVRAMTALLRDNFDLQEKKRFISKLMKAVAEDIRSGKFEADLTTAADLITRYAEGENRLLPLENATFAYLKTTDSKNLPSEKFARYMSEHGRVFDEKAFLTRLINETPWAFKTATGVPNEVTGMSENGFDLRVLGESRAVDFKTGTLKKKSWGEIVKESSADEISAYIEAGLKKDAVREAKAWNAVCESALEIKECLAVGPNPDVAFTDLLRKRKAMHTLALSGSNRTKEILSLLFGKFHMDPCEYDADGYAPPHLFCAQDFEKFNKDAFDQKNFAENMKKFIAVFTRYGFDVRSPLKDPETGRDGETNVLHILAKNVTVTAPLGVVRFGADAGLDIHGEDDEGKGLVELFADSGKDIAWCLKQLAVDYAMDIRCLKNYEAYTENEKFRESVVATMNAFVVELAKTREASNPNDESADRNLKKLIDRGNVCADLAKACLAHKNYPRIGENLRAATLEWEEASLETLIGMRERGEVSI